MPCQACRLAHPSPHILSRKSPLSHPCCHLQVVQEVYDEMVLWQPTEAFFSRYATHTARAAPPSQLAQFYTSFAPDAEYQRIQRARQRLAQIRANVENTAAQLEAQEAASGWAGA